MTPIMLSLWLREGVHRRWAHREVAWTAVPRAGDRVTTGAPELEVEVQSVTWDAESGAVTADLGALEVGMGEAAEAATERLRAAGWQVGEPDHEASVPAPDGERADAEPAAPAAAEQGD
jgi:hypothetical protein